MKRWNGLITTPQFCLKEVDYVVDVKVISAHDNMVAINNALAVDLSGQIAAETLGTRILAQAGGQTSFVLGALMSKGGRAITVIPSTARGGTVSRIVPHLPKGTVLTCLRDWADYVITEHGIARLWGKSLRGKTKELISVAHPDFRDELRREA